MAIKITGIRSIKSKLERIAAELENDAERLRDIGEHEGLAVALYHVASNMRVITVELED